MDELKKHPAWKEAVDTITAKVKEQGRGIFFSHEDLKEMLQIQEPKTMKEFQQKQFEYMSALDSLRNELLVEENIWLENNRSAGYTVMLPDDQVQKGADRFFDKAKHMLNKAGKLLVCVEQDLLSAEAESIRMRKMQKVAFLRAAFRKRTFPELEPKENRRLVG